MSPDDDAKVPAAHQRPDALPEVQDDVEDGVPRDGRNHILKRWSHAATSSPRANISAKKESARAILGNFVAAGRQGPQYSSAQKLPSHASEDGRAAESETGLRNSNHHLPSDVSRKSLLSQAALRVRRRC